MTIKNVIEQGVKDALDSTFTPTPSFVANMVMSKLEQITIGEAKQMIEEWLSDTIGGSHENN